jgi:hypothetical protein
LNSRPLPYQGSALPLSYNGIDKSVIFNVEVSVSTIDQNLNQLLLRAADEIRTRDIQLGRLTLYQLSYHRFIRR